MIANNIYVPSSSEPSASDNPDVATMRDALSQVQTDIDLVHIDRYGALTRAWAAGRLFERVVETAGGDSSSSALVDALQRMSNETVFGVMPPMSWPPGPHLRTSCAQVLTFDGERWTPSDTSYTC
jgi:hypothetical protein